MTRFKTRLSLESLGDRIVPDGTPLTDPTPVYTPGDTTPTEQPPIPGDTTNLVAAETEDDNAAKIAELRKQIAANNAEIAKLEALKPGLDAAIKIADADVTKQDAVVKAANANADKARDTFQDLLAKDAPRADLNAARAALTAATATYNLELAKWNGAQGVLDGLKAARKKVDTDIADLQAKNAGLEEQIKELQKKADATEDNQCISL